MCIFSITLLWMPGYISVQGVPKQAWKIYKVCSTVEEIKLKSDSTAITS